MESEILCLTCAAWVDCGERENKPRGFCLTRDLFTYTAEIRCNDYIKGNPVTEKEFESAK